MLALQFHVDTRPANLFVSRMSDALRIPGRTPGMREGMVEAANWYLGGMMRRYRSASDGDGTWPDLAPATKLARLRKLGLRYKREKGVTRLNRLRAASNMHLPILIDEGDLYRSLQPDEPGNILDVLPDRVRAGTADPKANYHQQGGGRLPKREILVQPDAETIGRMRQAVWRAVATTSQFIIAQVSRPAA